jgi:Kef-type K+ transport system membrane component KefB
MLYGIQAAEDIKLSNISRTPRDADPGTVAFRLILRGEVGLIFAGLGVGLKVNGTTLLDPSLYAAIIAMVFVTTAITPPLLERRLGRIRRR